MKIKILFISLIILSILKPAFATKVSPPVIISEFYMQENPYLNKPVKLFCKLFTGSDEHVKLKIFLPKEVAVVSGSLEWDTYLKRNQEQIYEITIKATKMGRYQIGASVEGSYGGSNSWAAGKVIYVEIMPDYAIATRADRDEWDYLYGETLMPVGQNNPGIVSELIISGPLKLGTEFTVIYRVTPPLNIPNSLVAKLGFQYSQRALQLIDIKFPPGGRMENPIRWIGKINPKQAVEIKATFKAIGVGWCSIGGFLYSKPILDFIGIKDVKVANLYIEKGKGKILKIYNRSSDKYQQIVGEPHEVW